MGNWGTKLENVVHSRGVPAAEALDIRSRTAHTPHLLPVKVIRDKDSRPNSNTETGVARQPTPASKAEYLNRIRLDLPTNCRETLGLGFA